jgi:Fur family ferric uptake transcriptional regulator
MAVASILVVFVWLAAIAVMFVVHKSMLAQVLLFLQICRNYDTIAITMTDIVLSQLQATLKAARQSLTKPRRVVFESMQHQEPMTMHELVTSCANVDRASVYRTITLFEQLNIVQRLQTGWKYKLELSDAFHAHHHHATCLHCGAVIPLPEDVALESQLQRLAAGHQFKLQSHQLELSGICQECSLLQ